MDDLEVRLRKNKRTEDATIRKRKQRAGEKFRHTEESSLKKQKNLESWTLLYGFSILPNVDNNCIGNDKDNDVGAIGMIYMMIFII